MPIGRAVWIGVVAYIVVFVIGTGVAMTFGLFDADASAAYDFNSIPPMVWYIGIVTSVSVVSAGSWWFFKSPVAQPSAAHGFYFGLVSVAVGFVLDIITVLPLGNPIDTLGPYYVEPFFIGTLIAILVGTTGVGYMLGKK